MSKLVWFGIAAAFILQKTVNPARFNCVFLRKIMVDVSKREMI